MFFLFFFYFFSLGWIYLAYNAITFCYSGECFPTFWLWLMFFLCQRIRQCAIHHLCHFWVFILALWLCYMGRYRPWVPLLSRKKCDLLTQYPTGLQPNPSVPWNSISHPSSHVMLAPFLSLQLWCQRLCKEISLSLSASIRRIWEMLRRTKTFHMFSVCRYSNCHSSAVLWNGAVIPSLTLDQAVLPQLASFESFTIAVGLWGRIYWIFVTFMCEDRFSL